MSFATIRSRFSGKSYTNSLRTRMNGLRSTILNGLQNCRYIQVGLVGRRRSHTDVFVGLPHKARLGIRGGVHCDRRNVQRAACSHDTLHNLTAIGNQHLVKGALLLLLCFACGQECEALPCQLAARKPHCPASHRVEHCFFCCGIVV